MKKFRIDKENVFVLLAGFHNMLPYSTAEQIHELNLKVVKAKIRKGLKVLGPERGFDRWLARVPRGQLFLSVITEHGEAKCRARQIYDEYYNWYHDWRKAHDPT